MNSPAPPIRYLATDLDRTLFPNGSQEPDSSLPLLKSALPGYGIRVIYVTGRNQNMILDGIREFDPPLPDYAIADVGSRIYRYDPDQADLVELTEFPAFLREQSPHWSENKLRLILDGNPALEPQPPETQNEFKLSYFCDPNRANDIAASLPESLAPVTTDIQVISSIDETKAQGLIDVMPSKADKFHALDYLRHRLGIQLTDLIYAGDSGNDLQPLVSSIPSILVANATDEVRRTVREAAVEAGTLPSLFFAKPDGPFNGCYFSGVYLGLKHYGWI